MCDCLILGGGVIGLSLAYELAGEGLAVRVLDRGEPGREASWAGAGILPPAAFRPNDPPHEQLAGLSHQLHPRLADQLREATGVDTGYRRCGGLYLARDAGSRAALGELAAWWTERGIRAEPLPHDRLRDVEPALALDESAGAAIQSALLVPDEAQLRNPRHLKALLLACAQRGVEISPGQEAEDFKLRGSRVEAVVTAGETIAAGRVCITSGCWSGGLARRLGCRTRIKPVRGQMVLLRAGRPLLQRIVNEQSRYLVPRADGRILVGSTEEEAGFDRSTTAGGIGGLIDFATSLCPALAGLAIERAWAGLRPGTADGLPYLGRIGDYANAFIAAGHFRSGLQLSAGTARVMGQLIRGVATEINLAPLSPQRG